MEKDYEWKKNTENAVSENTRSCLYKHFKIYKLKIIIALPYHHAITHLNTCENT